MSGPEPHEAVVGRRGQWVRRQWVWQTPEPTPGTDWDAHWDGRHGRDRGRYERQVILRLTLTMIGVWGLWAVVGGSAYLVLRWLRIACWITGCPA